MTYDISKKFIGRLPDDEQASVAEIGQYLVDLSGGLCHLCEGTVNPASDVLQADHHIPEAERGPHKLDNLRITHKLCNNSKKNLSSDQVRPYLKFRRYLRESGGRIKYTEAIRHWGVDLQESTVEISAESVQLSYSDGTASSSPIFADSSGDTDFHYAFVEVPMTAVFNDEEVQPRFVRHAHIFAIYNDLLINPLHEPPNCRFDETPPSDVPSSRKLLMFDGQHKTIASWMAGRERLVFKLYLDLDRDQATRLVNSIQAKIKKLPLAAFELTAKMAQEWAAKATNYEAEMVIAGKNASEAGFLQWLPSGPERRRGQSAFRAALAQEVWDREDLSLKEHVTIRGVDETDSGFTETMAKNKVIDQLIYKGALDLPFADGNVRRQEETDNICVMLNEVVEHLVEPNGRGKPLTEVQSESLRRFFKQGSLAHISGLLRSVYRNVMLKGDGDHLLDGVPVGDQEARIKQGIRHICEHPVWTADLDRDSEMLAVKDMLSTHQNVNGAFTGVVLTLGYALSGKTDQTFKAKWLSGE